MRDDGYTDEDIEYKMYYKPAFFLQCIDRHIPPPSILYWRVRAVFVFFGNRVDSKSKKKCLIKMRGLKQRIFLRRY